MCAKPQTQLRAELAFLLAGAPERQQFAANPSLTNVARDELGHLEHADLALAVENRAERVVSVNLRSLGFVLKAVLLDVVPKLFGQFGTGQRCRTDDSGELVIRLDRSHEGGIGLAF